jgi:hypothetical protein
MPAPAYVQILIMWIPTWAIVGAFPVINAVWIVKVWKYDVPMQNKSAVDNAAREKREMTEHFANQKEADRILESLVAAGAPGCILSVRRTSSDTIEGGDRSMNPTQTLQTYLQFHKAMKLYGDE